MRKIGFLVLFAIYHFPEFFPSFWIMASFKIGFILVAFLIAKIQGFKGLAGFGLGLTHKTVWNLLGGIIIGLLFFALATFASIKSGFEEITSVSSFRVILGQLPLILLMTAVPSLAEDILTRGYFFAHLKFLKPLLWITLSSAIYVLNHIWRLGDGAAVLSYLLILGIVLAFAVLYAKSLWLAFGIHWGANIAFELTHSFIETNTLVDHDGSNWLLAAAWSLLLIFFMILYYNSKSKLYL